VAACSDDGLVLELPAAAKVVAAQLEIHVWRARMVVRPRMKWTAFPREEGSKRCAKGCVCISWCGEVGGLELRLRLREEMEGRCVQQRSQAHSCHAKSSCKHGLLSSCMWNKRDNRVNWNNSHMQGEYINSKPPNPAKVCLPVALRLYLHSQRDER
jgi:hypothetical protein